MSKESKEQERTKKKGFSGLSELTSDVDELLRSADRATESEPSGPRFSKPTDAQAGTQSSTSNWQPKAHERIPGSSSGVTAFKWIAGVAVVAGVVWVISVSNNRPSIMLPTATGGLVGGDDSNSIGSGSAKGISPKNQQSAKVEDPISSSPAAQKPIEPSRPSEDQPPVGTGLVLGVAQIRYCLAEDIRIDGARATIDNYSGAEVDRFNAMIDDYNNRCSNFRYRTGDLEQAKRDIEPFRNQLRIEGRESIDRSSPAADKAKSSNPIGDATPVAVVPKNLCKTRPKNGKVLKKNIGLVELGHRLTIKNGSSSDAVIKLRDASTGKLDASFYVKKNMSASLDGIPDGRYRVQFAYGDAMTRDCASFIAPSASAFNDVQTLRAKTTATEVITQELSFTLFTVPGGNVQPVDISADEFNGD